MHNRTFGAHHDPLAFGISGVFERVRVAAVATRPLDGVGGRYNDARLTSRHPQSTAPDDAMQIIRYPSISSDVIHPIRAGENAAAFAHNDQRAIGNGHTVE